MCSYQVLIHSPLQFGMHCLFVIHSYTFFLLYLAFERLWCRCQTLWQQRLHGSVHHLLQFMHATCPPQFLGKALRIPWQHHDTIFRRPRTTPFFFPYFPPNKMTNSCSSQLHNAPLIPMLPPSPFSLSTLLFNLLSFPGFARPPIPQRQPPPWGADQTLETPQNYEQVDEKIFYVLGSLLREAPFPWAVGPCGSRSL